MADSFEKWAERILANYNVETGWLLASEWQKKHGPLEPGLRSSDWFFCQALSSPARRSPPEYKLDNLGLGMQ